MTSTNKSQSRIRRKSNNSRTGTRLPRESGVDAHPADEATLVVSNIRWITDSELAGASQDLRRLKRIGKKLERGGDYFGSGNIAYQLRQIVGEIQALVRGRTRAERRN